MCNLLIMVFIGALFIGVGAACYQWGSYDEMLEHEAEVERIMEIDELIRNECFKLNMENEELTAEIRRLHELP